MEYPVIYLCIHKELHKKKGMDCTIEKRELYTLLGRNFHIPKTMLPVILKEMENLDLVENLGSCNNNNVLIKPIKIDPEENTSMLYKKVGLF